METNRALNDPQLLGNARIRISLRHQPQHLYLPLREHRDLRLRIDLEHVARDTGRQRRVDVSGVVVGAVNQALRGRVEGLQPQFGEEREERFEP